METTTPADTRTRDLRLSLALLAVVVAFAIVGLASDGNWPKIVRVSLSFLAYAGILLLWLRRGRLPEPGRTLPFLWFASAGAGAGLVSRLVRPHIDAAMLAAFIPSAALPLGGIHWLALAYWRRLRAGVTARAVALALALACMSGAPARAQTDTSRVTRQSDVVYGHKYGLALTLEVFTPGRRNGLGVLWVVSSSGRSSREQTLTESFQRRIAPLLEHGYAVFAVIVGSAPLFDVREQATDVRRAIRFVRSHATDFGVDPGRLAIAGASAGGSLALLAAMAGEPGDAQSPDPVERASSRVQAAGAFFPPTDLVNYGEPGRSVLELMRQRDGAVDPAFQFHVLDARTGLRTPVTAPDDVARILAELSPVTHVTKDAPPTILIHGDSDQAVPVQQSRVLAERLKQAGVPVKLVERAGAGHAYPGWEGDVALLAEWFDATPGGRPQARRPPQSGERDRR